MMRGTTVSLPLDQLLQLDTRASENTALWSCQLCSENGIARDLATAEASGSTHLRTRHAATIDGRQVITARSQTGWANRIHA